MEGKTETSNPVVKAGMSDTTQTHGFTLVELIVATSILLILSTMALPLARVTIKREKEKELRAALWQMRDAIHRYKDSADLGKFQIKAGSEGYPPDLDTLVKGESVGTKKVFAPEPHRPGLMPKMRLVTSSRMRFSTLPAPPQSRSSVAFISSGQRSRRSRRS